MSEYICFEKICQYIFEYILISEYSLHTVQCVTFFLLKQKCSYRVVEPVGGGSDINRAYPIQFPRLKRIENLKDSLQVPHLLVMFCQPGFFWNIFTILTYIGAKYLAVYQPLQKKILQKDLIHPKNVPDMFYKSPISVLDMFQISPRYVPDIRIPTR